MVFKMTDSEKLYNTVIRNGFCIGCGVCASVKGSPFIMKMDKYGNVIAEPKTDDLSENHTDLSGVCPFAENVLNEDELSEKLFPNISSKDPEVGKHLACFAGFAIENGFREKGSSGGLAKWFGYTLLKGKEIDYLIQVAANETNDPGQPLFVYKVFDSPAKAVTGSKSAYYPTSLDEIIQHIEQNDGRYAITGVPCFIKALRLLSEKNPTLKSRITYTFGIICGGMKSANHAKLVGWELGVHPEDLIKIEFRRKYENRPANEKIYQVWSRHNNVTKYKDVGQIYGTGYAAGFFKPKACDYCDDVMAETADISFGDAWLKKYIKDPKGTSLVVVRNKKLLQIMERARDEGLIKLNSLTAEEAAWAQKGGLRHRREGLSRRIAKKEAKGEWYPPKRIKANQFVIGRKRKRIYDIREKIAIKSHTAFAKALKKNKLSVFHKEMNPLILRFAFVNFTELLPGIPRKLYLYAKQKLKRIIR
jgi:coenzyme F420 hydrogenase subunit beta